MAFTLLAGTLGAGVSAFYHQHPRIPIDLWQVWIAARVLGDDQSPYLVIGPGRLYPWDFPLLYPLPAAAIFLPLAPLSFWTAQVLFVGLSSAALGWALTRQGLHPRLWVLASAAYLAAVQGGQWSVLLTAASQLPWLSFAYAAKPTIALALWLAYPSWLSLLLPAAVASISVLIWPWWVDAWLATLTSAPHIRAPITLLGGPILLAALWKWRLPEARLLLALACIPHTTFLYEAIPLFLIVKRAEEGVYLAVATIVTAVKLHGVGPDFTTYMAQVGTWMVWLLYLPCLLMVLRRR